MHKIIRTPQKANIRIKEFEGELVRSKKFHDKKIESLSNKVDFLVLKIPVADIKLQGSQNTNNEFKNIFPKYNQEPPSILISKQLYSDCNAEAPERNVENKLDSFENKEIDKFPIVNEKLLAIKTSLLINFLMLNILVLKALQIFKIKALNLII